MVSRAALVVAAGAVVVLVAACTPAAAPSPSAPSASASPTVVSATPTPTPTETWSPNQKAAIQAVDAYSAAGLRIGTNPAGFTEKQMTAVMNKVAGPAVVKANVSSFMDLRKRGFRYDGSVVPTMTIAHPENAAGGGVEVYVTRCNDQSGFRVVDKNGQVVDEATLGYPIPAFNLRQYTVRKSVGENRLRVFEIGPIAGRCGP